jgi:hypothetical protein
MAIAHGGALTAALHDLQHIFRDRLLAVVTYGAAQGQPDNAPAPSLVLVSAITADDLDQCAARAASWHRAGCATPLLLTREEFAGSLDAFPIEYGEIIESHRLVYGVDPFAGLTIRVEDIRREIETLIKSHLVHLRENYIECRGRQSEIGALVADAAQGFARLLRRLARLDALPASSHADLIAYAAKRPVLDARTVGDILAMAGNANASGVDPVRLYPAYLKAVEQLWHFIDGWRSDARQ